MHILLTEGGITPQNSWKRISYIPFDLIHRKWQYHLLTMLKENIPAPRMKKDVNRAWKKYPKGFVAYVEKEKVPPGGGGLVKYLAKYVVSPPISVRRIQSYDGQKVRYGYRDHKTEKIEHETLPALRFIGRMVQHIRPKGFQRIRYYGLHSNVRYSFNRAQIPAMLPAKIPVSPKASASLPANPLNNFFSKALAATRFSAGGATPFV